MGFLRRKSYELLSSLLGGGSSSSLMIFGQGTPAGKVVTPGNALQISTVWSCNRILSESVGMLPFSVYKRLGPDANVKAPDHPYHRLLHDEPNPEMSSMDFRMCMTSALCLWGNAYAEVVRNGSGKAVALWPLPAQLVDPSRDQNNNLVYKYTPAKGGPQVLQAKDVLHLRTMSFDGIRGVSPITQGKNCIGLAMALEEYASRFFANGGIPGIVLQHPGKLGIEAAENIRKSWKSLYGGVENSNEVAVTEEDMKLTVVGVDPQKAQSVEARRFQIAEAARLYRMQLHLVDEMSQATFSNIEQQSIEFVTYTLMPYLKVWEQAIQRTLFAENEKATYFSEFNVDGLLRGDIASRYAAYAIGRNGGWLSSNDIRRFENLNPIEGGDVYLQPLNMVPIGTPPLQIPATPNKKLLAIRMALAQLEEAA